MDTLDLWGQSVRREPDYADRSINGWPLVFGVKVRFEDIDLLGHVNNVTYGTYFEEARMDFLRWLWYQTHMDPSIIVAHLDMDFRRPLYLHDQPVIGVNVGEIGNSRFDLLYRIVADETICEGRTINVWYDYDSGKPAPVPTEIRDAISKLQG